MSAWPDAALDRIARLRVLAAGLPGVVLQERVIDAPFDDVWGFVSDLERATPRFDRDVAALRVLRRDGTRLRVRARSSSSALWLPFWFDVDLEPGWCWMVSRPQLYLVGMAAEPTDDGARTRFGHLEGVSVKGGRLVTRALRPLHEASRRRHVRHIRHDLDGIEREVHRQ